MVKFGTGIPVYETLANLDGYHCGDMLDDSTAGICFKMDNLRTLIIMGVG